MKTYKAVMIGTEIRMDRGIFLKKEEQYFQINEIEIRRKPPP